MLNMKTAAIFLSGVIASLGAAVSAQAAITSTAVSASMHIFPYTLSDIISTQTGATYASVNLTYPGTPLNVQSTMQFSSHTAESAVFDFLIGMHGNDYSGLAGIGVSGQASDNSGILHYSAATPMTATASYDYVICCPGADANGNLVTFGMNPIGINSPSSNYALPDTGTIPKAGTYHSTETFNLAAGDNLFMVSFTPNANGPIGWINGQYQGTATFNFAPPVPEPETYAMMLVGLGLLGFAARRRKQKEAVA